MRKRIIVSTIAATFLLAFAAPANADHAQGCEHMSERSPVHGFYC